MIRSLLLLASATAAILIAGCAGKTNLPEASGITFPQTLERNSFQLNSEEFPRVASREHQVLMEGDVLKIELLEDEIVSGDYLIGPDGMISVPLAGEIKAAGRVRSDIADAIRTALADYYTNPRLTLSVAEYTTRTAYVLGGVISPGATPLSPNDNLLTVLSKAGGPKERFNEREQSLGLPQAARILRGSDTIAFVNLKRILDGTDFSGNVAIFPEDVVFVPLESTPSISILGEVRAPGLVGLGPGMDIVQAVSLAGGFTSDADKSRIYVIRGWWREEPQLHALNINDIFEARGSVPPLLLEDQDIVFVETRGLAKMDYVLSKITPAMAVLTSTGMNPIAISAGGGGSESE